MSTTVTVMAAVVIVRAAVARGEPFIDGRAPVTAIAVDLMGSLATRERCA